MKTNIRLWALILTLVFVLTGCSLALPEQAASRGRLIGVYITLEPLDLTDPENFSVSVSPTGELVLDEPEPRVLEAELKAQEDFAEDGTVIHSQEYRFPDAYPGYSFFATTIPEQGEYESYLAITGDPVIDGIRTHIHETDEGTNLELEAKVYAAVNSGNVTLYYNPVYQREDGSVFAVTGSGMSTDTGSVGQSFSQKMEDTVSHTENGKTTSEHTSVTLSLEVIEIPDRVQLLQMDKAHRILHESELSPDELPDALSLLPGTEYVICENLSLQDGKTEVLSRDLYDRSAETLQSFIPTEKGLCVSKSTQLLWPEA